MIAWPPIFCISLKQTPDRRKVAEEHFRQRGLPVRFFEGLHGLSAGIKTSIASDPKYRITPGHCALILNHWFLWQHLLLLDPVPDEAMILEDDAAFPEDFAEQYLLTKAALPDDWDFWFIGTVGLENKPLEKVNDRLCRTKDDPFGTHCYLVRGKALPILVERMAELRHHVDIQLARNALPHLKWFCSNPNLVRQRSYDGECEGTCHGR